MATEQKTPTKISPNGSSGAPVATARGIKKRKRLPKWGFAAIALVIVGLGWFAWVKTHPPVDPTSDMILGQVTTGSLVESVSATGSITAQTGAEVNIGSQITGIIKRLYADVGSHVTAGEVIAVLDLPTLRDQVGEANAALNSAQVKLQQTVSGVTMTNTQILTALATAKEAVTGANAQLATAQANARQQVAQTPADIEKAATALSASKAALTTAQATLAQTQAGANEQIATAKEQQVQAVANAANAAAMLKRQQSLLGQGFVAQSVVDQAQATATVDQSLVTAAQQNVSLVQQSVTASLQTNKDAVAQAQENVKAAQASLNAAKSETYTTQAKIEAVANAKSAMIQAQQAVTVANANLAQIQQEQQNVQVAKATVAQAQSTAAYNQDLYNEAYIRTPISGTVITLAEQQGDTVAGGLSAPTLVVVADLTRLEVDTYVDESDISSVKLGQDANVVLDAFPKHTFHGKVVKIASGSTIQNGVVTYDVVISFKQHPKYRVVPDMTASVTIETGNLSNVLLVPAVAVQVGVNRSTVSVVTTKNGQTAITPVAVKTGGSDGTNIQILSGLTAGQTIVVAGAPVAAKGSGTSAFSQRGGGGGGRGGGGGGGH